MKRKDVLNKISSNIKSSGHHITIVSGGQEPRYAYTIGLIKKYDFELILAGSILYLENDIYSIVNFISSEIKKSENLEKQSFAIENLGTFRLIKVHDSWAERTMLGVYDYYNLKAINAYQIVPDDNFSTIDIPDMSLQFDTTIEPVWKWLEDEWSFEIPNNISVVTNLDAMKGESITQIMRWEEDEWEMFAGSNEDLDEEDIRVVPIGLLLTSDKSLLPALDLDINKGLWRENKNDEWNDWG